MVVLQNAETDTMSNRAGSSGHSADIWSPHCDTAPAQQGSSGIRGPVDWYVTGAAPSILCIAVFWHKFLYDMSRLQKEPYGKRTSHGMILGENGEENEQSRGNVVNPDDVIAEYGADTLRLYERSLAILKRLLLSIPVLSRPAKCLETRGGI